MWGLASRRATVAASLLAACGTQETTHATTGHTSVPTATAADPGLVVATVDGAPLGRDELVSAAQDLSLSAATALRLLEAELLLAGEAERLGYGSDASVTRAVTQAMVQRLLADEVEQVQVSGAQVGEAYRSSGERFRKPERRAVAHVVVKIGKGAEPTLDADARKIARQFVIRFRQHSDEAVVLEEAQAFEGSSFEIVAEQIAPFGREAALVHDFVGPVFEQAQVGVLPRPVRTEFGWHAIKITQIAPEQNTPLEEVRAQLRRELAAREQRRRFDALVERLESRSRLKLHGELLEVLDDPGSVARSLRK